MSSVLSRPLPQTAEGESRSRGDTGAHSCALVFVCVCLCTGTTHQITTRPQSPETTTRRWWWAPQWSQPHHLGRSLVDCPQVHQGPETRKGYRVPKRYRQGENQEMSRPKQDPSGMVGDEWQWRERERGGRKKNDQALNPKQVHYSSKIHIPIAPKKKKQSPHLGRIK